VRYNSDRLLGAREPGTARLEEAVQAYRAALQERTPDRVPLIGPQPKTTSAPRCGPSAHANPAPPGWKKPCKPTTPPCRNAHNCEPPLGGVAIQTVKKSPALVNSLDCHAALKKGVLQ